MDNQYSQKIDPRKPDGRKSQSTEDEDYSAVNVSQAADPGSIQRTFSQGRFLIITIGGIFLAEVVAMIVVYGLPSMPYYLQVLIDASIMVVLIFPLVYYISLKPLLLYIHKHQQLENALRQSEERFALAYRSNPAALSIIQVKDGRFIEVNESFLRLYGYARSEVIGFTSDELNLYANLEERKKLEWLLLKQRTVDGFEMTTRIKSGEIRNISVSTEAIELAGEVNILAVASDITDRKQAQEKLRKAYDELELRVQDRTMELRMAISELENEIAERKKAEEALRISEMDLKHAQEVARIGSWKWNLEKGEVIWSDEMYRIFGIDKNSYTGRLGDVVASVIHPDDLHLVLPSNARSFVEKDPIEYRIILPDKSIRHIWAKSGEAIVDDKGKPIFLTGIAQDITERKQNEEKIRAANNELMRFNNAMVGRELRMIELKKEVNALCEILGQPARYPLDFEKEML